MYVCALAAAPRVARGAHEPPRAQLVTAATEVTVARRDIAGLQARIADLQVCVWGGRAALLIVASVTDACARARAAPQRHRWAVTIGWRRAGRARGPREDARGHEGGAFAHAHRGTRRGGADGEGARRGRGAGGMGWWVERGAAQSARQRDEIRTLREALGAARAEAMALQRGAARVVNAKAAEVPRPLRRRHPRGPCV